MSMPNLTFPARQELVRDVNFRISAHSRRLSDHRIREPNGRTGRRFCLPVICGAITP